MYKVELSKKASKQLKKLYKSDYRTYSDIFKFIDNELNDSVNPRQKGKALQGNFKGYWRYRVGNFRIITEIKDDKVIVLVLDIGHRKEIYDK